jgi:hypothetical protein
LIGAQMGCMAGANSIFVDPAILHDDEKVFLGILDQANIRHRIAINKQ